MNAPLSSGLVVKRLSTANGTSKNSALDLVFFSRSEWRPCGFCSAARSYRMLWTMCDACPNLHGATQKHVVSDLAVCVGRCWVNYSRNAQFSSGSNEKNLSPRRTDDREDRSDIEQEDRQRGDHKKSESNFGNNVHVDSAELSAVRCTSVHGNNSDISCGNSSMGGITLASGNFGRGRRSVSSGKVAGAVPPSHHVYLPSSVTVQNGQFPILFNTAIKSILKPLFKRKSPMLEHFDLNKSVEKRDQSHVQEQGNSEQRNKQKRLRYGLRVQRRLREELPFERGNLRPQFKRLAIAGHAGGVTKNTDGRVKRMAEMCLRQLDFANLHLYRRLKSAQEVLQKSQEKEYTGIASVNHVNIPGKQRSTNINDGQPISEIGGDSAQVNDGVMKEKKGYEGGESLRSQIGDMGSDKIFHNEVKKHTTEYQEINELCQREKIISLGEKSHEKFDVEEMGDCGQLFEQMKDIRTHMPQVYKKEADNSNFSKSDAETCESKVKELSETAVSESRKILTENIIHEENEHQKPKEIILTSETGSFVPTRNMREVGGMGEVLKGTEKLVDEAYLQHTCTSASSDRMVVKKQLPHVNVKATASAVKTYSVTEYAKTGGPRVTARRLPVHEQYRRFFVRKLKMGRQAIKRIWAAVQGSHFWIFIASRVARLRSAIHPHYLVLDEIFYKYGNALVTFGSLLALTGTMMSDMRCLRTFNLMSGSCYFMYNMTRRPALSDAAVWNCVFFLMNSIMLYRVLTEHRELAFTSEEMDIFEKYFLPAGMSPRQFRKLMRMGRWRSTTPGFVLQRQGQDARYLWFVVKGTIGQYNLNISTGLNTQSSSIPTSSSFSLSSILSSSSQNTSYSNTVLDISSASSVPLQLPTTAGLIAGGGVSVIRSEQDDAIVNLEGFLQHVADKKRAVAETKSKRLGNNNAPSTFKVVETVASHASATSPSHNGQTTKIETKDNGIPESASGAVPSIEESQRMITSENEGVIEDENQGKESECPAETPTTPEIVDISKPTEDNTSNIPVNESKEKEDVDSTKKGENDLELFDKTAPLSIENRETESTVQSYVACAAVEQNDNDVCESSAKAIDEGNGGERSNKVKLPLGGCTSVCASDCVLFALDIQEVTEMVLEDPVNWGLPIIQGLSGALLKRSQHQQEEQILRSYDGLLFGALADGRVAKDERALLLAFRRENGITDSQHHLALERQGWTEEDFERGEKVSAHLLYKVAKGMTDFLLYPHQHEPTPHLDGSNAANHPDSVHSNMHQDWEVVEDQRPVGNPLPMMNFFKSVTFLKKQSVHTTLRAPDRVDTPSYMFESAEERTIASTP